VVQVLNQDKNNNSNELNVAVTMESVRRAIAVLDAALLSVREQRIVNINLPALQSNKEQT